MKIFVIGDNGGWVQLAETATINGISQEEWYNSGMPTRENGFISIEFRVADKKGQKYIKTDEFHISVIRIKHVSKAD